ncbi:GNAT family N-acetyltransferase [Algoriphagus halophytocola]|uniref:GNAT family N-acetyltransferase n=1 Tax=Algoriphagus halophytocola TaxID=2991499 RepID=A0ABY6MJY6_9BACT|nr:MULTISPECIES: GNAT family N-acetyltransferase [unclassified Algoriphagus]UZD23958.1 GNAT family N-acetyltransferase [Algoriphagus sp. TR-M5]WBL41330.1 GNAT family N-acetyltransferase [Algoriphagus sp. TR-M9]
MNLQIQVKTFAKLTNLELYAIIKLRNEVFVVEQNCVYQDADGKDLQAFHVMISRDGQLLAYARVLPPGISYPEVSIGRVLSSQAVRATGLGLTLMTETLKFIQSEFGNCSIRISAQTYLDRYYRSFGFEPEGNTYLEDGIEHIEMTRDSTKNEKDG